MSVYGDGRAALPRRVVAAGLLLNVPGLGVGYGYLGHRLRAVLAAVGTAGLVSVAFATDAADRPWLWRGIAVVWLAAILWDTWRLTRLPGSRPADRWGPVVVGGVLLAVVVAGLVVYAAAGRNLYLDGVAAQRAGDCATAVARFDTVTGPYELTLSDEVPAARTGRVECGAYAAARQALDREAYRDAVARYRDIRRVHPGSALVPVVERDLARGYGGWAGSLRASGDHQAAIDVYREQLGEVPGGRLARQVREDLAATHVELAAAAREGLTPGGDVLRQVRPAVAALLTVQGEFGDTAVAPQVPQAIADVVAAALATVAPDDPCAALPVLDYAVALPAEGTGGVVATAEADRAGRRLDCGIARFGAEDYAAAGSEFDRLLADHPDSPQAAQARSAAIAARIGADHYSPVALPGPFTGDVTGDNAVTFYNDSPVEVLVQVSGPTAHEFTLAPCPECPATYDAPEDACPTFDGRPSYTLRLAPGTYLDRISSPADDSINATPGRTTVDQGYDYTSCLHVEEREPYSPYRPIPDIVLPEPVQPR